MNIIRQIHKRDSDKYIFNTKLLKKNISQFRNSDNNKICNPDKSNIFVNMDKHEYSATINILPKDENNSINILEK